jgi:hypothetical protein
MVDARKITAQVLAENPLPATVEALDPFTRARIEREAAEQGVSPALRLASAHASSADEAQAWNDAHAMARKSRRPSW